MNIFNRNLCIWNKLRNKTQKENIKCISIIKQYDDDDATREKIKYYKPNC